LTVNSKTLIYTLKIKRYLSAFMVPRRTFNNRNIQITQKVLYSWKFFCGSSLQQWAACTIQVRLFIDLNRYYTTYF